jgi:8-oxo-dGTP pyrophosphatase MutT (NUDIX family)
MNEDSLVSLSSIINDEFKHKKIYDDKKNRTYCSNCNKYGHIYKKCNEPITSIGIINLYLGDLKLDFFFMNKYVIKNIIQKYKQNNYYIKNILLSKFNEKNNILLNDKKEIDFYIQYVKSKLKILMIRRKNTVGYIEFIRGHYNEFSDESILFLLNQMTTDEINYLKENNFDKIWNELWNGKYNTENINQITEINDTEHYQINLNNLPFKDKHLYIKVHLKEYNFSKEKFQYIKNNNIFDILKDKINIQYDEPEWGFPKGRRNTYEQNINCAIREFEEESGIKSCNIDIMDRIYPVSETFKGTNNLDYKHLYYLSIGKLEDINLDLPSQKMEIGDIGWFNYEDAKNIIRPYHINRLKILDEIVLFISHNLKYYASFNKNLIEE